MSSESQHSIHRNKSAPWGELRVSVDTRNCYRPHTHAEYSLGIVDDGCATFLHPDGSHVVTPGSVVLIEPGVLHSCNPEPGLAWSYRMLFIDAAWLHSAVSPFLGLDTSPNSMRLKSRCVGDLVVARKINELFQNILSGSTGCAPSSDVITWIANQSLVDHPEKRGRIPTELVPAFTLMHKEREGRITVKELAATCGMSSFQFIRRFRSAMGATPGSYLLNLRVNGARRLVAQGVPLTDAAHTMGFSDQAHFQRAFKARHAMTPGAYKG